MKMAEVIRGASHPMGAVDALVSPHGCVRLSAARIDTQMQRQILDNRIIYPVSSLFDACPTGRENVPSSRAHCVVDIFVSASYHYALGSDNSDAIHVLNRPSMCVAYNHSTAPPVYW
jgi:hypothetical protein